MTRPLHDVRVLEFCSVASGPFCGLLLADMGADVVKIENPRGGDSMRTWPPLNDGYSENFASLNRNKRSVALDLKDPTDKQHAVDLAREADVVVENNRPGVMDRLGLGFADLREHNERIVYCSISAFGQDGPRAHQAGFDLTVQAISGIMSVTGEPDGPPVKCGVPVSDFATGLYAAFAISSALRDVATSGRGTHIDTSMFGSSLAIAALQTSQLFGTDRDPLPLGAAHPRNAPYEVFACGDGHVAIAAGNNALWRALCEALDRTDLLNDGRFVDTAARATHQAELKELLEAELKAYERENLLDLLTTAGVPAAPINTYSQAIADPQTQAMGWVEPLELPDGNATRTFGSPLRFEGQGFPAYRRPPRLGEHTEEVAPQWSSAEAGERR